MFAGLDIEEWVWFWENISGECTICGGTPLVGNRDFAQMLLEHNVWVAPLTITGDLWKRARMVIRCRWSHAVPVDAINPYIPAPQMGFVRKSLDINQSLYRNEIRVEITDEEVFGETTGNGFQPEPEPPTEPERKINFREFL